MKQMKIALIGTFLLLLGQLGLGQGGINFFHGTLEEARSEAAATGRLVFMDAYTTWCGPCKWMAANAFADSQVGDLFNSAFVNVKVDMEAGEGPMVARKYGVRAYPTVFILHPEGRIMDRVEGALGPADLYNWAADVLVRFAPQLMEIREPEPAVAMDISREEEMFREPEPQLVVEDPFGSREVVTEPVPPPRTKPRPEPVVVKDPFYGKEEEVSKPRPAQTKKEILAAADKPAAPSQAKKPVAAAKPQTKKVKEVKKVAAAAPVKKEVPAVPKKEEAPATPSKVVAAKKEAPTEMRKPPVQQVADAKVEEMPRQAPAKGKIAVFEQMVAKSIASGDKAQFEAAGKKMLLYPEVEYRYLYLDGWRSWTKAHGLGSEFVEVTESLLEAEEREDAALYEQAARFTMELGTEESHLVKALGWARRAVDLQPDFAKRGTFAQLLYATGDKEAAAEQAQLAVKEADSTKGEATAAKAVLERLKQEG